MDAEHFFAKLAGRSGEAETPEERAPARVKATLYSALVRRQTRTGRLLALSATQAAGHPLCVFEDALRRVAVVQGMETMNPCRVCHARVLAEHFDSPPVFWEHCPYVIFRR